VLVTGANGSGKTNLLEALHVGTQGFSPRTRSDAHLVRHGADHARVTVAGRREGVPTSVEVTLARHAPKRARLNGAPVRSAEHLRTELTTLVFTPDRLAVVKGGPAVRRAYLDRSLGRLLPSRAPLPLEYGAALGQRNAAIRRIAAGHATRDSLSPWTERVVVLGAALVAVRLETLALLAQPFAERAGELGLADTELAYEGEPLSVDELDARLDRDLERGSTGLGPHLHEIAIRSQGRDLRTLGSQGEQRLAVLALLLAEAELLADRARVPPLVLLDDALSELDADRRRILSARLGHVGQAIVTATGAEAMPLAPAQLLVVAPGVVRTA
jgi:DNA replication and repair protein RecF